MHVVATQRFTVLKSFSGCRFPVFSFRKKYFFFNSFESVFFPLYVFNLVIVRIH